MVETFVVTLHFLRVLHVVRWWTDAVDYSGAEAIIWDQSVDGMERPLNRDLREETQRTSIVMVVVPRVVFKRSTDVYLLVLVKESDILDHVDALVVESSKQRHLRDYSIPRFVRSQRSIKNKNWLRWTHVRSCEKDTLS